MYNLEIAEKKQQKLIYLGVIAKLSKDARKLKSLISHFSTRIDLI